MEKITVLLWDSNDQPTIKKSFQGEWLVEDIVAEPGDDQPGVRWSHAQYSVAKTQKGALAVYISGPSDDDRPSFGVYPDFEEFKSAEDGHSPRYPANLIAEVASALDIEYEQVLDI